MPGPQKCGTGVSRVSHLSTFMVGAVFRCFPISEGFSVLELLMGSSWSHQALAWLRALCVQSFPACMSTRTMALQKWPGCLRSLLMLTVRTPRQQTEVKSLAWSQGAFLLVGSLQEKEVSSYPWMFQKHLKVVRTSSSWTEARDNNSRLDLCFQALNGFVITVTGDGYIFYVSPTVQNYLGFHQVGAVCSWVLRRPGEEVLTASTQASLSQRALVTSDVCFQVSHVLLGAVKANKCACDFSGNRCKLSNSRLFVPSSL